MKASLQTIAMIRSADESAVNAAKAGVTAVIALIRDNLDQKFPHGAATELAALLKDGKVTPHTAKRYADLTAMAVKAINLQSNLAAGKVKAAEKTAARSASIEASLTELAGMVAMAKVREWSKANGPKADKAPAPAPAPAPTPTEAPAQTEAPTEAPAPINIEAIGQLREIREIITMINAGQVVPGEALATIANIVGVKLAQPTKTARTRANGKANKPAAISA